jgi:hypothetical protein
VGRYEASTARHIVALIFIATAAFAQSNQDGDPMEGQISFGLESQNYNGGRISQVGSIDATIRLMPRLTIETVASGGAYFGDRFGGGGAYFTIKPHARTYLTLGGIRNSNTSTTVAWGASFEAGRGIYQSRHGVIRGLETDFNLTQRGYRFLPSTGVLLLNPRAVVYLPRDWTLTLRGGAIRTTITGVSHWTPSSGASLNVPVTHRLSVSPSVAFDSEATDVLQVRNISSRGFGSGVRFWLTDRTTAGAYYFRVLYGANHLTNNSYGVSYALRF